MKYTFVAITANGDKFYPMKFGDSPMDEPIGEWTDDIEKAIKWNSEEDCRFFMDYYYETELVKVEE